MDALGAARQEPLKRWGRLAVGAVVLVALAAAPGCLRQYVFSRLPQPVLHETRPPEGLTSLSTATCASCHAEIAAEWRDSQMGQAWTDPVFQADFTRGGQLYACRYCHTPLPQQQPERVAGLSSLKPVTGDGVPNPGFDASLLADGVGCASCHVRDGANVGLIEDVVAPHAVRVDPTFGNAALCAACHQADAPPFSRMKRPIADTVEEWKRWTAATGRDESCIDCHMPAVERPLTVGTPVRATRSHRVLGAWNDDFVASAIQLGEVQRTADGVTVTLTNLAGHNVPTADPMRALDLVVRLVGEGLSDESRFTFERIVTDRTYVERGDSTLLPGETRAVALPFSAASLAAATDVVVELVYDRLRNVPPDIQAVRLGSTTVSTQTVSLPRRP